MAQITTIQPLDFLKNSRSIINQNFVNLNNGLSALSLSLSALSANGTGTSYPTRNLEVNNYGMTQYGLNDKITLGAANVVIQTLSPLLNGDIVVNANNGIIKHVSEGPGTQLVDNCHDTEYGGSWLEFYRTNTLSGLNILNGTAYNIRNLPYLESVGPLSSTTVPMDALVFGGTDNDTSLYFSSSFGNPYTVPGIYVPSVNNAALGRKLELNGPGVVAQELTIGGQLRFNPDNFDGFYTSTNSNLHIKTDLNHALLSADSASGINVYGDVINITTTNPLKNGNITLNPNNGFVIVDTEGPGLQIKDNCHNTLYGGTWVEFYRTNANNPVFNGTAYTIRDLPNFPVQNNANDTLALAGMTHDTSILIAGYLDYNRYNPGIYIPSYNNSSLSSARVEITGHGGLIANSLLVGGQTLYGDIYTTPNSSINFFIGCQHSTSSSILSAEQNAVLYANDITISTVNPLLNGNITLASNNGYVIVDSGGPGLQIKDNLRGNTNGGSWIEFYRTNAASGIFEGTAYAIKDISSFTTLGIDTLGIMGTNSDANIYLAANTDYHDDTPAILITSTNNAASSGTGVSVLGTNGLFARALTVGNTPYIGTTAPSANTNFEISYNDFTHTVYLSALEATTTLQIGSVSTINFADNSTQTTAYTGAYTPAVPSNWNGAAPTTIQGALDRIAAAIKALNGVGP